MLYIFTCTCRNTISCLTYKLFHINRSFTNPPNQPLSVNCVFRALSVFTSPMEVVLCQCVCPACTCVKHLRCVIAFIVWGYLHWYGRDNLINSLPYSMKLHLLESVEIADNFESIYHIMYISICILLFINRHRILNHDSTYILIYVSYSHNYTDQLILVKLSFRRQICHNIRTRMSVVTESGVFW